MGETTGISWTDHTFNPWIGCQKISPACKHCYATVSTPTRTIEARTKLPLWGTPEASSRHLTAPSTWNQPLAWHRAALKAGVRRRVFCASLADVFEDNDDLRSWRSDLWVLIEKCTALDWQLLTKRPENIRAMVPPSWLAAWPSHVWVGTTVESQATAEERIPHLLKVPARVRFLSCEPLLEAIDLSEWLAPVSHCSSCGEECEGSPDVCPSCRVDALVTTWGETQAERYRSGERYDPESVEGEADLSGASGLSWVIVGGESGPGARPFDLAWARSIVAQCDAAGVPVFVKQMGGRPITHRDDKPTWPDGTRFTLALDLPDGTRNVVGLSHHGADPSEWPADLRRQESPR